MGCAKYMRDQDNLSEPSYTMFHFKGDDKQKSVFGGMVSLIALALLIRIIIENSYKLFTRGSPHI